MGLFIWFGLTQSNILKCNSFDIKDLSLFSISVPTMSDMKEFYLTSNKIRWFGPISKFDVGGLVLNTTKILPRKFTMLAIIMQGSTWKMAHFVQCHAISIHVLTREGGIWKLVVVKSKVEEILAAQLKWPLNLNSPFKKRRTGTDMIAAIYWAKSCTLGFLQL